MRQNSNYDLRVFLAASGIFLVLFLLTMAQIFAFEDYKPSRLFTAPDQTNPILAQNQTNTKGYKPTQLRARIFFTTKSLMVGNCSATIPLEKTLYTELNPNHKRLEALFTGPGEFEKSIGYTTRFEGWQQVFMGTVLQSDGTLLVRFSEEVINPESEYYLGKFDNDCGRGVWQQIYLTSKEDSRVKYVVFTVNDNPSLWNSLVNKRECPPLIQSGEDPTDFIQAQKQCANPDEIVINPE